VLDIAWLIYAHRLSLAGYPLARLHPNVNAWAERLKTTPAFAKEISQLRSTSRPDAGPPPGATLEQVAGF
jgi:glutathione S-transferase